MGPCHLWRFLGSKVEKYQRHLLLSRRTDIANSGPMKQHTRFFQAAGYVLRLLGAQVLSSSNFFKLCGQTSPSSATRQAAQSVSAIPLLPHFPATWRSRRKMEFDDLEEKWNLNKNGGLGLGVKVFLCKIRSWQIPWSYLIGGSERKGNNCLTNSQLSRMKNQFYAHLLKLHHRATRFSNPSSLKLNRKLQSFQS